MMYYLGGTRAPITIKRASLSESFGFVWGLTVTATTIPSTWSAFPNASAADSSFIRSAGSNRISTPGIAAIGTPAKGVPIPGEPGGSGTYTQPALSKAAYNDSQNAIPSSAPWVMAAKYRWPLNAVTAAATNAWRSGPSVRGDFRRSSWRRASAASLRAISAPSLAVAASFFAVSAVALACAVSFPALTLYVSNLLSEASASSFCNVTTAAVVTTTATAANAANPKAQSIACSQECKPMPNRFTIAEAFIFAASALSVVGILATLVWISLQR